MSKSKAKGRGNTLASKLGYEDVEFTTIDGRKLNMGEYFKPDDFAVNGDDNEAVIKHDGMQRVLFNLFTVAERTVMVHQSPQKQNEWCAVVSVCMRLKPKIVVDDELDQDVDSYIWEAVADCRKSNAMPGMERYTTAIAETRASGRVIRRMLGLEDFCTREELAETTIDVEDDTVPIDKAQLLLLKGKFLGDKKLGITIETINKRLKRSENDKNFITDEDDLDKKLTRGQAADLIAKLHRYDIEGAKQ